MRVLLDTCVWGGARGVLQAAGHDVIWTGEWQRDPGDAEILAYAYREQRVLVTLDKDFGELAIVHRQVHAGIVRLVGFSAREHAKMLLLVLANYEAELTSGALITVDDKRVRVRPAEK